MVTVDSRLFAPSTNSSNEDEMFVSSLRTKKVAALHALKIKTHSAGIACEGGTEEVSTRRAFTNISELVDGLRVWHYKRGKGMLVWHFEVGREDKQYPLNGFRRVPRQIKNTQDAGRERVDQLNELMAQ